MHHATELHQWLGSPDDEAFDFTVVLIPEPGMVTAKTDSLSLFGTET